MHRNKQDAAGDKPAASWRHYAHAGAEFRRSGRDGRQRRLIARIDAYRMAEAARAHSTDDVVDDVVRPLSVARNAADAREVIEPQIVAGAPGDNVIRERCVTADAEGTDDLV